ncbi:unnamed protein product [Caenorhabditis angaria]|uniref:RING-type domain-containing protein n=1 Tax=Caenorhabditis angaria TaxID=860376 RepID=A0A9P1I6R2_9PELO|nr:unnamed protein product [Caenorhabditis angaria]
MARKKKTQSFNPTGFMNDSTDVTIQSSKSPSTSNTLPSYSSWEETDRLEEEIHKNFMKSQRRVNNLPIIVETTRRRVDTRKSLIKCPSYDYAQNHEESCNQKRYPFSMWKELKVQDVLYLQHFEDFKQNCRLNYAHLQLFMNNVFEQQKSQFFLEKEIEVRPKSFEFSMPSAPHYIELDSNGKCFVVPDSESSPYAIIYNNESKHRRNIKTRNKNDIKHNNNGYSVKKMNKCERLLYGMKIKSDAQIIRFDSVDKKKNHPGLHVAPICVTGSFDYSKTLETMSIEFRYNHRQENLKYAKLQLVHFEDIHYAENVLMRHGILVRYADDKFGEKGVNMFLSNIPKFVDTDDYLKWFIKNILSANEIKFRDVHFEKRPVRRIKDSLWGTDADPKYIVCCDLMRLIHAAKLLPNIRLISFLDLHQYVVEDELPFKVTYCDNKSYDSSNERRLVARFYDQNVEMGKILGEMCLYKRHDDTFLHFTTSDTIARVHPRYKKMIPINSAIRYSYQDDIIKLDQRMKSECEALSNQNPAITPYIDNDRIMARIVDDFEDNSEDGFIGIEGWPPSLVDRFVEDLKTMFVPKVIDCHNEKEHFLYGFGEAYARWFMKRNRLVIEFDRFRNKMWVFGSKINEFVKQLANFDKDKENFYIESKLQLIDPFSFDVFCLLYKFDGCPNPFRYTWHNFIQINETTKSIDFKGPSGIYEIMNNFNHLMSMELLRRYSPSGHQRIQCPVCLCDIGINFFRLENCGHFYCRNCINRMISSFLADAVFEMRCCFEKCENLISPTDIKTIYLGDETRLKVLDNGKLEDLIARATRYIVTQPDSNYNICKTTDCAGFFKKDSSGGDQNTVECFKCHKKYCNKCFEESHEHIAKCEDYARICRDSDYSLQTYLSTEGRGKFRICPTNKCKALIEKIEGCNHVECAYCHVHFCWICLFEARKMGDIYRHMAEVHGGSGGEFHIDLDDLHLFANDDETLDVDIQRLLLRNH